MLSTKKEDKNEVKSNVEKRSSPVTPSERRRITQEYREKHQPYFDSIDKPESIFILKMVHLVSGLDGLQVGFFQNELEQEVDLYIEKVDKYLNSEDEDRNLYKWTYNPFFKEEYELKKSGNGHIRYLIPLDELELIDYSNNKGEESQEKLDEITDEESTLDFDPNTDARFKDMTIRDFYAIIQNRPVSSKKWLNELIKS